VKELSYKIAAQQGHVSEVSGGATLLQQQNAHIGETAEHVNKAAQEANDQIQKKQDGHQFRFSQDFFGHGVESLRLSTCAMSPSTAARRSLRMVSTLAS